MAKLRNIWAGFAVLVFCPTMLATNLNLGYLSFQSGIVSNSFIVNNFTGSGIACGADFQSCTPVDFIELQLTLTRGDGTQFTVAGSQSVSPGATINLLDQLYSESFLSARLTGRIDQSILGLMDGSVVSVSPVFDTTLLPDSQSGSLNLTPDLDLSLIRVDVVPRATPEPSTGLLFSLGLAATLAVYLARSQSSRVTRPDRS